MQANMWLGTLLMDRSEDIYRMKGLMSIDGMDERFVFQVIDYYYYFPLKFIETFSDNLYH